MADSDEKIFIIGLPRTGTTSICCKFLELGFRVAHTAYTEHAFTHAQVIADTPVFTDYKQLFHYYPNSKFVYLERDLSLWTPSIKQLLQRMHNNVVSNTGGFNPIIKRCYQRTFSPFTAENIDNDSFLTQCYLKHQQEIFQFFSRAPQSLLTINVSAPNSLEQLLAFINLPIHYGQFEQINKGGKVTAWKSIKHPLKVSSTTNGKASTINYQKSIF